MAGFAKTLKIAAASVATLVVLALSFVLYANYSSGVRAGVPVEFSRKGVIFKTYEGELNLGGITNTAEGTIPTTWDPRS